VPDLQTFALGFTLGLSLAVPPGPVNAVIASEGAVKATRGTLVGLGAMTADATFMVLTLVVGNWLPESARRPLTLVGGMVFVAMGVLVLRSSSSGRRASGTQYLTGLTMGLTNPFQIAWWLTAGLTLVTAFGPLVVAGFFSGIVVWIIAFPLALRKGVVAFGSKVIEIIKTISAGVLFAYGIWFFYLFVEGSTV
jgi:threonine/homoserine/homoserine lactone efflux protein